MTEHSRRYNDTYPEREGVEWGNFNTFPSPARELTHEHAMVELFQDHMGPANLSLGKQCKLPGETAGYWDVDVFIWTRGTNKAIAVCSKYERRDKVKDLGLGIWASKESGVSSYGYAMRFFKIGCEHKNAHEMGPDECRKHGITHYGMFDHHWICDDCGFKWGYDSSG